MCAGKGGGRNGLTGAVNDVIEPSRVVGAGGRVQRPDRAVVALARGGTALRRVLQLRSAGLLRRKERSPLGHRRVERVELGRGCAGDGRIEHGPAFRVERTAPRHLALELRLLVLELSHVALERSLLGHQRRSGRLVGGQLLGLSLNATLDAA